MPGLRVRTARDLRALPLRARFRRPLLCSPFRRAAIGTFAVGLGVLPIARTDRRIGLQILEAEQLLVRLLLDQHADDAAVFQRTEQNLLGERLFDVLLDHAGKRTGAELVVIAAFGKPSVRLGRQLDGDVAVAELRFELEHELFDHLGDDLWREACECE